MSWSYTDSSGRESIRDGEATQGQKVEIDAFGRKVTAYIQREHDGWYWATTTKQNADKGYTLKANGEALREEYRDGERVSSVKVGLWRLA